VSDAHKSFFSGLHGAITGLAAFVTSIVAVVGLALNQGWIGGHTKSTSPTTPTVPGETTTSTTTTPGNGTSSAIMYSVVPTVVSFQPFGPNDAVVTLKNSGTVGMTVETPTIDGRDSGRFAVTDFGCTGSVDAGLSCPIKVTFTPAPGTFNARMIIRVVGAPQSAEVALVGKAIL
jgi:hypothetical protein